MFKSRRFYPFVFLISLPFLASCGANKGEVIEYVERPVEEIYNEAMDELTAAISSSLQRSLMRLNVSILIRNGRVGRWSWPPTPITFKTSMSRAF